MFSRGVKSRTSLTKPNRFNTNTMISANFLTILYYSSSQSSDEDVLRCSEVCEEIKALLASVDLHDHDEMVFLQEVFLLDEGGEG